MAREAAVDNAFAASVPGLFLDYATPSQHSAALRLFVATIRDVASALLLRKTKARSR